MVAIILLSLIIDLYLNYYIAILPNFFIYLKPLLFITTLIVLTIINYQKSKKVKTIFIILIIYDLLFGKVYFLYPIIFLILFKMISYLKRRLNDSFFSFTTIFIINLITFIIIKYVVSSLIGVTNQNVLFLINQVSSYFILNVLYSIILYYYFKHKEKKNVIQIIR